VCFGAVYAYSFVSCAPGASGHAIVDNCANIVLWCAAIGWWLSALAFGVSLFALFKSRSTSSRIASWVSGVYFVPVIVLVAFLALH